MRDEKGILADEMALQVDRTRGLGWSGRGAAAVIGARLRVEGAGAAVMGRGGLFQLVLDLLQLEERFDRG